jgi:transcriptional regulator with XRE-family HTH domain
MAHRTGEIEGIGARLRAARDRLGWSRETLAFHSGISWPAIAQVESGRRTNVRPSTLAALSAPLGVTIDYLVNGVPFEEPMLRHSAFTYSADEEFQRTMGSYLAEGVEQPDAMLALTTAHNIGLLRDALGEDARHVSFVESSEWLTTPDEGLRELRAFRDGQLRDGAVWLRLIAEPIWDGRSESEARLWTRFESLLNLIFRDSPMTLVCPYDTRLVTAEILREVRLTHPHLLTSAGRAESPAYSGPGKLALEP